MDILSGLRAALYLRKSRAEEGLDTDRVLARHRAVLEDWARLRGLTIAAVYPEVVSGESLHARPEMLRLLEDVEAGRYDCVLCMELDRLSRGRMRDQGLILDTLREHAVRIVTPDKTYDLSDDQDEEYAELKTFLARREYKMINRRLQRGLEQSIREGCHCSNPPYGYRRITVDRRPTLAVYEPEARFVRMMFRLYAGGWGCTAIAQQVSALGAVPHRSARFCRNSVRNILTSPTYAGRIFRNRDRPPEEQIRTQGLHPALVSPDLFRRCQEIMGRRYTPPHNDGTVRNPLQGLVYCGVCGSHMQMAGREPYLMCPKKGCCAAARLSLVEQRVRIFLDDALSAIPLPAPDGEDETLWKTAQTCAKLRLTAVQHQKERLHALLELGEYDLPTFRARMQAVSEQEAEAERRLAELQRRLSPPAPQKPHPETLAAACDSGSPALRNAIYRGLVEHIIYTKEKKSKPGAFSLEFVMRPL